MDYSGGPDDFSIKAFFRFCSGKVSHDEAPE